MSNHSSNSNNNRGFTIVELMIATLVFSIVLLIAMTALIQIAKLYYKGITNSRTQEQSRNIMAEVSQSIQYSRQDIRTPTLVIPAGTSPQIAVVNPASAERTNTTGFFCVGPRRYSYVLDRKLSLNPDANPTAADREKESRHVFWVDTPLNGCEGNVGVTAATMTAADPCDVSIPTNACSDGVELMSENMRLAYIRLSEVPTGSDLWTISIAVIYGDDELLEVVDNRYVCEGSLSVSEFCGISELSTTVMRRL